LVGGALGIVRRRESLESLIPTRRSGVRPRSTAGRPPWLEGGDGEGDERSGLYERRIAKSNAKASPAIAAPTAKSTRSGLGPPALGTSIRTTVLASNPAR
jgi:hypothetical protein